MSLSPLQTVEEQLKDIISSYSRQDWKNNKDELSRIRALTIEHRNGATGRPAPRPVKESAASLQELLELPDNGQASSELVCPILDTLDNEKDVDELCSDEGLQPKATAVAKAVYRSLARPESIYTDIWQSSSNFYKVGGTTAYRLLQTETSIVNAGDVNGARYRINAILFALYFRTQCEELGLKGKQGTVIIKRMMKDSGKNSDQIKSLLKLGRWYALWVSELGLGAILMLGECLAWNNQMHEIGRLIMVCKAMPGFCEKSRNLCEPARKAIVQAIILSGQTAPVTAQRYIDYPGTTRLSPSDRNGSATSDIANLRDLNSLPCVREVNEQLAAGVSNPAPFSEPAASGQRVGNVPNLHPQWQSDTDLIQQHETAAQTASLRTSPNTNNATLTEAEKALLQPRATNYPESQAQPYYSANQGYGDVGADPAWDGTPYNTQGEGWDVGFWGTTFTLYN